LRKSKGTGRTDGQRNGQGATLKTPPREGRIKKQEEAQSNKLMETF